MRPAWEDRRKEDGAFEPHGLILQRRIRESLVFRGDNEIDCRVTLLDVQDDRIALGIDLPLIGQVTVWMSPRRGRVRFQIDAEQSVRVCRGEISEEP